MTWLLLPFRGLWWLLVLLCSWLPLVRWVVVGGSAYAAMWIIYWLVGYDGFALVMIGGPIILLTLYFCIERAVFGHWWWQSS